MRTVISKVPTTKKIISDDGYITDITHFIEKTTQSILTIEGENAIHLESDTEIPVSEASASPDFWVLTYEEYCHLSSELWQFAKEHIPQDEEDKSNSDYVRETGTVRWAEDGFCTLEASSDVYAAALMCTSAEGIGLGDVKFPSQSMVFRIPPGLIDAAYARIDISGIGNVNMHVCGCSHKRAMMMKSDTVDDLLFTPLEETDVVKLADGKLPKMGAPDVGSPGTVRNATPEEVRTFIMIRHYIAGLLVAYQVKSNWTYEGLRLAQAKRLRKVPPRHRYFILGKSVKADVREGVRRYVGGDRHRSPSFQFVVRGHYRNQAHGPNMSMRRVQWIEPYWKTGKDVDAPILARSVRMGTIP
jgi:hypothetical protein